MVALAALGTWLGAGAGCWVRLLFPAGCYGARRSFWQKAEGSQSADVLPAAQSVSPGKEPGENGIESHALPPLPQWV